MEHSWRLKSSYDEPFYWWGPRWSPEPQLDIAHLLRDGTLDVAEAAALWTAIANRRSVTVIGGPSHLGKTTLLSALLQFMPVGTRRLHLRGAFETFAFLRDPHVEPRTTALLINEISPHLPIYLWGDAVARVLTAAERGFMVLATAHGSSVPEFVGSLTGSPLRIPVRQVAALDIVVLLEASAATPSGRRVAGIWELTRARDGVAMTHLTPTRNDISTESNTSPPHPPPLPPHFSKQHAILAALRDGDIAEIPIELGVSPPLPEAAHEIVPEP